MRQGLLQALITGGTSMILWETSGVREISTRTRGMYRNRQDAMNAQIRIARNPKNQGYR